MKEIRIDSLEGTEMESEVDAVAEGSEWGDEIFITPDSKVIRVDSGNFELFRRQNPDLGGWTKVLWGVELENED
jgi:hypothetical protein